MRVAKELGIEITKREARKLAVEANTKGQRTGQEPELILSQALLTIRTGL